MRANPRDWRIEDVATVCRAFPVELERLRSGGSHWKVRDTIGGRTLIIPVHKPINQVYVKQLVAFLEDEQ